MYRLLIVDDEPIILNGIKRLVDFEALKIDEIYEAADGVEALRIVDERQPDIVLADINMPNMDGLALARAIKQRSSSTKVAIITGYDYFDYAVAALKAGVDDYLLKPVSRKDIQELLQKLVDLVKDEEGKRLALQSCENLSLMSEGHGNKGLDYKTLILNQMHENLSNPDFSLGTLAQAVNLSQGYLSTLFKTIFGLPFQDFLVAMRLERSKILLLSNSYKVYEIAEQVGFDDPNYFSTSFRKHFGLSPNQFRKVKTRGSQ